MKKMIFFASLLLMLIVAACGKENKTAPLSGNPNLYTITEQGKDGQPDRIGVANPQSGHIVIPPKEYKSVSADNYTIACINNDNITELFKTNGDHIGDFEMITRWSEKGNYYLGVRYIKSTYYFPEKDLIISTTKKHTEHNFVLLENAAKDGWNVYDYYGNLLWQAPQNIGIIKNSKNPTNLWFAIESKNKKPSCVLYAEDGTGYKAIPPVKWAKLKKTLKNIKEVTPTTYTAVTDDFSNF